jgi:hypothetical protein
MNQISFFKNVFKGKMSITAKHFKRGDGGVV